ncbi:MAG: YMGG-like glycine zipper-containing protein [Opitutaceae bacterium]|nr:YMGG-like glycine zipper-containing protein [Opitutaceae bacterium]
MNTKFLAFCLLGAGLVPAQAQVFRPEVVSGAALGALAGAIIGNNSGDLHHNGWAGAAIGAGAGALLGAATAGTLDHARHDNTQVPVPYDYRRHGGGAGGSRAVQGALIGGLAGAIIGNNSGHHHGGRGAVIGAATGLVLGGIADASTHHTPYYSTDPVYRRPAVITGGSRAVQGALIGGLAGAIIGNNSGHHHGGRGAVIGAATGLVLGGIADGHVYGRGGYYYGRPAGSYRMGMGFGYGHQSGWSHGRYGHRDGGYFGTYWEPAPVVVERPIAVVEPAPAAAPAPQQITIINNYYGSTEAAPMSGANGLFGR